MAEIDVPGIVNEILFGGHYPALHDICATVQYPDSDAPCTCYVAEEVERLTAVVEQVIEDARRG